MELKRYAALLRSWAWLVALFTLLAAGVALAVSLYMRPAYEASAKLLLDASHSTPTSTDYSSVLANQNLAQTYSQMLVARPVLDQVIANLGLRTTAEQLGQRVTVSAVRNTQLIALTVEDSDPGQAARIANEIVTQFTAQNQNLQAGRYTTSKDALQAQLKSIQDDTTRTQDDLNALQGKTGSVDISERARLESLLAEYRSSAATLLKTLEDIRLAEAQSSNNLVVVEPARPESDPVRPKIPLNTVLGAVLGLLLGLGFVILHDYLDDSIKSSEDAEHVTGLSTLGAIAPLTGGTEPDRLVTLTNPRSPVAEAYRVLASNVQFTAVDAPIRTLLITSGGPGEGKTTTSANLAVALAQMGRRVILVDADLRRPSLHRYFAVSNQQGLTTAMMAAGTRFAEYLQPTGTRNLWLLPSGVVPPNPGELLGSRRMAELVQELKSRAEIVVFDSPPALAIAEAGLLARYSDATLLVVNTGVTRSQHLKRAKEQLAQAGTRLAGLVLNRVTAQAGGYYYSYYYGDDGGKQRGHKQVRKQGSRRGGLPFFGGRRSPQPDQGTAQAES